MRLQKFWGLFTLLISFMSIGVWADETTTTQDQPFIEYSMLEDGFRISVFNMTMEEMSDCTWNGMSVCKLIPDLVEKGIITVRVLNNSFELDVSLKQESAGLFDDIPVFGLILLSGEVVEAPIFFVEQQNTRYWSIIRWVWIGYKWVTKIIKVTKAAVSIKKVRFGHGVRHLKGTGLNPRQVENAIISDMKRRLKAGNLSKIPIIGNFPRIQIKGITIEYKPYYNGNGIWNVGTYYPK